MDVWTRLKPNLDVQWMFCAAWDSSNLPLILQSLFYLLSLFSLLTKTLWYQHQFLIYIIDYIINKSIIKLNNLYYIINLVNNTTSQIYYIPLFILHITPKQISCQNVITRRQTRCKTQRHWKSIFRKSIF